MFDLEISYWNFFDVAWQVADGVLVLLLVPWLWMASKLHISWWHHGANSERQGHFLWLVEIWMSSRLIASYAVGLKFQDKKTLKQDLWTKEIKWQVVTGLRTPNNFWVGKHCHPVIMYAHVLRWRLHPSSTAAPWGRVFQLSSRFLRKKLDIVFTQNVKIFSLDIPNDHT